MRHKIVRVAQSQTTAENRSDEASWRGARRRSRQCSAAGTILEDSAVSRPEIVRDRYTIIRACPRTTREIPNSIAIRLRWREKKRRSQSWRIYRPRTPFPVSIGSRIDRKYVNNGPRKHGRRGNLRFASIFDRKLFLMRKSMSESNVAIIYLKWRIDEEIVKRSFSRRKELFPVLIVMWLLHDYIISLGPVVYNTFRSTLRTLIWRNILSCERKK